MRSAIEIRVPDGTSTDGLYEKSGHYFFCLTGGVVYPGVLIPAVLAELLFPDDWSLLNPF